MPSTDIAICDGCGADVVIILKSGQTIIPHPVYCPGCTKLNAAKASWAQQQARAHMNAQQVPPIPQGYYKGGLPKMAYPSRGSKRPSSYSYSPQATQQVNQCSFTWDMPRMAYAVVCQYQPNFIEFIKAKIPASDRAWDPTSKTWYIKDAWFDIMFELASQLWPGAVAVISRADAEKAWKEQEAARAAMLLAQRQAVLGPFEAALLDFCALCDVDALRKARNAMAIALHPDKGGDPNKMAKLNASWFVIETEFKKLAEKK